VAAQVFETAAGKPKLVPSQEAKTATPQLEEPHDGEVIIWACVRLDGKTIGVEVLGIEGDLVRVQALPAVTDKGKLEPQFPFSKGNCTELVHANDLMHLCVFRNG
jgi:hypothetical protein